VIRGFVDDYTFMVRACLDVYESLHDEQWLEWAVTLQHIQDTLFWDENHSAYFTTTLDDPSIVLHLKEGLHSAVIHQFSFRLCNLIYSR